MSERHADELRRKAEQQLAARDRQIATLERADLASLAHELAVHQIELEIQNEELRRSRTLAEEARDRYLDLYDFAPVGYFTLDEHVRIVEANLTGCRLLRAGRLDLLDKRFTEFLPEEETDKFYFHRKQTLEGIAQQTCELKMRQADGALFDARLESLRAAEGRLRVAVIDVTERKRAEAALRDLNATLESKVAQRTQELEHHARELEHRARQLQKLTLEVAQTEERERRRMAEILHDDLQQIIAAAKFHLSMMRNRMQQDAPLQAIGAQIDAMLKDAIEKSRSLSHELSPAVLHHGDLTETLGWLAGQIKAKHGLVVHVHASGKVDRPSDTIAALLYRVAQELLFNVVKHARTKEAGVRVRQYRQCVCLSVSDHGRGFNPQGLPEASGYGLLSIRERIELLGGHMRIRSTEGKGSAIFVIVPNRWAAGAASEAGTASNAQTTEAGRSSPDDKGRLRVLLADDHRIVREGLRSLLNDQGDIEIVGEAAHGREAVDLAVRLEPDVVIMDVAMPLIDGDAATRQIKEHLPQTRVIALSTYNEPEVIQKMYRAGAEGYVLKTASSDELLAVIRGKQAEMGGN